MNKIKVVNNKIIPFVSDDVEINDNNINFNNNGNYFIDYYFYFIHYYPLKL